MPSETDRIEKRVLLQAPRERVWRALTTPAEFGHWFGMRFEGEFVPGATVRATLVPTAVDAQVAALQKPYEGTTFEIVIDRLEPQRLFSFRWHPGAPEPGADYSAEPMTLVAFELREAPEGILLVVSESGFDRIPLARRAQAFQNNEEGWGLVLTLVDKHLAGAA